MQYTAHWYNKDVTVTADRFELRNGSSSSSGLGFSGGSHNTWTDAVFYNDGDPNPVAFAHAPDYVVEATSPVADDSGLD